ncbi:hypothetical protein RI367_000245 [Sorochytrium milnesiophthora]
MSRRASQAKLPQSPSPRKTAAGGGSPRKGGADATGGSQQVEPQPAQPAAGSTSDSVQQPPSAEQQQQAQAPQLNASIALGEALPDGAIPLFLSTATVDIFKLGEHFANSAATYALIDKQVIQADMFNRAAVSDFAPFKQQLAAYTGPQVLLIKDAEWKFGQNYIICISQEAFDAFLKPPTPPAATDTAAVGGLVGADAKASLESKLASRPRGWTSLGSEAEIEAERIVRNRAAIYVKTSRRRRKFGQGLHFSDRNAHDSSIECKPAREGAVEELHRMQCNLSVQVIEPMKSAAAQTNWFRPVNLAIQYEPRELSDEDRLDIMTNGSLEQLMESVSKIMEKALLQNTVINVLRNEYLMLAEEDPTIGHSATSALLEYQSFADLRYSRDKSISCVVWHPTQKGLLAVSCVQRSTLDERLAHGHSSKAHHSLLLIWSFYDPIHPQLVIDAPDEITSLAFCPTNSNLIVGGCVNGQVVLWDVSDYQDKLKGTSKRSAQGADDQPNRTEDGQVAQPTQQQQRQQQQQQQQQQSATAIAKYTAVSSIEHSHRMSINDVTWLAKGLELNHNGEMVESPDRDNVYQFVSAALDGYVYFWDLRYRKDLRGLDLVWRPFFKIPLLALDSAAEYGLTKLSLRSPTSDREKDTAPAEKTEKTEKAKDKDKDAKAQPVYSRLVCASEEGDVLQADWLVEKHSEDKAAGGAAAPASRVESAINVHFAPVCDVQRSPFFPDIFLTVGGWSFHVWKEKLTVGCLMSSPVSSTYLTGGLWSPTRPGVFFIAKADGVIEIWDIMDRSHLPSHTQSLSSIAITSLAVHTYFHKGRVHQQFMAVGDDDGTLHVLEVPKTLYRAAKNELSIVRAFFDREVRRVESISDRKATRARESAKADSAAASAAAAPANEAPRENGTAGGERKDDGGDAGDDAEEKKYLDFERALLDSLQPVAV